MLHFLLTLCLLGNFVCFFAVCRFLFSKSAFSKNYFGNTVRVYSSKDPRNVYISTLENSICVCVCVCHPYFNNKYHSERILSLMKFVHCAFYHQKVDVAGHFIFKSPIPTFYYKSEWKYVCDASSYLYPSQARHTQNHRSIYRGSYISAYVLLNFSNELRKRDKCDACSAFYLFFARC